MSTTPKFLVGSVEYLKVRVDSDVTLEDTEGIEIKLGADWHTAAWTGTPGLSRVARALVNFGTVVAGTYPVYVRLTDSPEIAIIAAGRVKVEDVA